MGKVYVKASPVSSFSSVQTYNWAATSQLIGAYDIGSVWTDPPGPYGGFLANFSKPEVTTAGTLTSGVLPSAVFLPQPGMIISAAEPTMGWGDFICLAIPKSTAIAVGIVVTWDTTYTVAAVAAASSSKGTGVPTAVNVSSATISSGNPVVDTAGGGLASNSTNVMYAWFQLSGRAWTLKTAVQVTPNAGVYISSTAGRVKAIASTTQQIIGARMAGATTTSTQSAVIVMYPRGAALQGS